MTPGLTQTDPAGKRLLLIGGGILFGLTGYLGYSVFHPPPPPPISMSELRVANNSFGTPGQGAPPPMRQGFASVTVPEPRPRPPGPIPGEENRLRYEGEVDENAKPQQAPGKPGEATKPEAAKPAPANPGPAKDEPAKPEPGKKGD